LRNPADNRSRAQGRSLIGIKWRRRLQESTRAAWKAAAHGRTGSAVTRRARLI